MLEFCLRGFAYNKQRYPKCLSERRIQVEHLVVDATTCTWITCMEVGKD